jgi:hemolysin activation/secretion protein
MISECKGPAGDSDLLVSWKQSFPLRLTFSVDNTGSKSTGKEQGGVTLSADHLMGMHDLFYAVSDPAG